MQHYRESERARNGSPKLKGEREKLLLLSSRPKIFAMIAASLARDRKKVSRDHVEAMSLEEDHHVIAETRLTLRPSRDAKNSSAIIKMQVAPS